MSEAAKLAPLLKKKKLKLVFAESCTGGMISAQLAEVPGISDFLCGSAVVYRNETKSNWLGISRKTLKNPGPVSRTVAEGMAKKVLERTPEADLSASITGYLGPTSPRGKDGQVFIGLAVRGPTRKIEVLAEEFWILPARKHAASHDKKLRARRQVLASNLVLFMVRSLLMSSTS